MFPSRAHCRNRGQSRSTIRLTQQLLYLCGSTLAVRTGRQHANGDAIACTCRQTAHAPDAGSCAPWYTDGTERHLALFWCHPRMAKIVRCRSYGAVLPFGRHASISGSSIAHCVSVSITPPYQEGRNARSWKWFKAKHALEGE